MAKRFVYVVGPEDGPYKVGVASDVRARLRSLQVASPNRLAVLLAIETIGADALLVEKRAHRLLATNRLVGEWFGASLEEVRRACEQAYADDLAGVPFRRRVRDWRLTPRPISLRIPRDVLAEIDEIAKEDGVTRHRALLQLIDDGFQSLYPEGLPCQ